MQTSLPIAKVKK